MAIYVHRVLNFDPERSLYVMNHFFAPWPLLLYTIVPMLLRLAIRSAKGGSRPPPSRTKGRRPALQTTARQAASPSQLYLHGDISRPCFYPPPPWRLTRWPSNGRRSASARQGRVTVVERHSTWEPTFMPEDVPYDTAWYGEEASYNLHGDLRLSRPVLRDVADHGGRQDRRRRARKVRRARHQNAHRRDYSRRKKSKRF